MMKRTDNRFFEEYKRLDKLCGEMLSCKNGVSRYIAEMEAEERARDIIPSWKTDHKTLKHLRWVRNQIAHDTSDAAISDEDDLLYVRDFYKRITAQSDPLSQLRKAQKSRRGGIKLLRAAVLLAGLAAAAVLLIRHFL